MKKLSKIIAIILSVALLCGVVFSFTASADNSASDIYGQLDLDNPEKGIRSVGVGDGYGHNNASISDWQDAYVDASGNIKGSITGNVKYYSGRNAQHDIVEAANGNKYLRLYQDDNSKAAATSHPYSDVFGAVEDANSIKNGNHPSGTGFGIMYNDYIVYDFDVMSDSYVNSSNELTTDNTGKLAYHAGHYIQTIIRATASGKGGSNTAYFRYSAKGAAGAGWYFWDASYANAKLSDTPGEWNHITMVYEIDNSVNYVEKGVASVGDYDVARAAAADSYTLNISNTKCHYYVNGLYAGTQNTVFAASENNPNSSGYNGYSVEYLDIYAFRNQIDKKYIGGKGTNANYQEYSFCYDNMALHYYTNGYNGDLANRNLEDPIYKCNDVVYSGDYMTPDFTAAAILGTGENTKNCGIAYGAVVEAIKTNQKVTLNESVLNFDPPEDNENDFYVKLGKGVTFSVDPASGYTIATEPDADGYYKVSPPSADSLLSLVWLVGEEPMRQDELFVGSPIISPIEIPVNATATAGVFNTITSWEYSIDNATFNALTSDSITEEMAEGANGVIYIRPVYQDVISAYTVARDGKILPYLDDKNFVENVNDLPRGSVVTLYKDVIVDIAHGTGIYVNEKTVIDLNGKTLTINPTGSDTSNSGIFYVSQDATLDIYSSMSGGQILCGNGIKYRSLIYAYDNCVINLGKAGDPTGENAKLNVYFPMIVESVPAGSSPKKFEQITGANPATININGGNYTGYANKTYAIFNARHACNINITGATVAGMGDELFSTDTRYDTGINVVAKDSKLIGTTDRGIIYYVYYKTSSFSFENCEIITEKDFKCTAGDKVIGTYYCVKVTYTKDGADAVQWFHFREDTDPANIESYVKNFYSATTKIEYYNKQDGDLQTGPKTFSLVANNAPKYTTIVDKDGNKISDPTNGLTPFNFIGNVLLCSNNGIKTLVSGEAVTLTGLEANTNLKSSWVYFDGTDFVSVGDYSYNWALVKDGGDKCAKVSFDGAESEIWYAGSAIENAGADLETELYTAKFAGWTKDGVAITALVAGEYTLTPEYTDVKVSIPGIKLNLTANNGFIVNFYVPTKYAVTADVKAEDETVSRGDETYYVYKVAGISPNNVEGATIVLTVNGTSFAQTITVSLLDYFDAVLEGEDDEAKTLVVNAVNYCNEVYKVANSGAEYAEYAAILLDNTDRIIAADAEAVDVDAKTQGVFGEVQFIISEGNVPMFAFTKLTDGKVSVKFTNIYGEETEIVCTEVTVSGTVYYAVAEMPVYEMIHSFEVYVNDAKIGNYSIANYVELTENKIAAALYGYGKAVENWKIED